MDDTSGKDPGRTDRDMVLKLRFTPLEVELLQGCAEILDLEVESTILLMLQDGCAKTLSARALKALGVKRKPTRRRAPVQLALVKTPNREA